MSRTSENNRVFVTGGAGYIGSHACKALAEQGYEPITLDNLSTGWKEAVKFGPFEHVDILNEERLRDLFQKYQPFSVMHFAGLTQVGESKKYPDLYWKNNVLGSLNLIKSAVKKGCLNIVFSSTCATYGEQENVILDETSSQNPINAYGASKLAVEHMLADFKSAYGLKYVIFRYFNVAGADPASEIGEFHQPETHLIPLILDTINRKRDSLTIFGTDYNTPDGTCIRDYVHVCDLVDAHLLGMNWLTANKDSRSFNLGTGQGFSVREVIDQAKLITNQDVAISFGKRRPGDCAKLVSGSERAMTELGWSADRSNLKQMIRDAQRWHQCHGYSM